MSRVVCSPEMEPNKDDPPVLCKQSPEVIIIFGFHAQIKERFNLNIVIRSS